MAKYPNRVISLIFLMTLTCVSVFAQQITEPKKIATLDDYASLSNFNTKLDELITEMLRHPETRSFIALTGKDYPRLIERLKAVRAIEKARPELKRRISYTQPGVRYEPSWKETEFWLIPDKSDAPYVARIHDCDCAVLAIDGKTMVDKKTQKLTYSTGYPTRTWLDEPITFTWLVKGGKIISGQGTQSISVKKDRRDIQFIEVTLKVHGWDEDCMCLNKTSFTTTVVDMLPKEF